MTRLTGCILTVAALSCLCGPALAQRSEDNNRFGSSLDQPRQGSRERNVAGDFDYYALVMSWSPTYCSEQSIGGDDPQCNRRDGRRYNFVLHGLWPQYERGFPDRCRTPRKPFVPRAIIDSMLDIMPSPRLVIHEYRKHGTCSGLKPAGYYELSRKLFESIRIPQRFINPIEAQLVSPGDLEDEILQANPGMTAQMLSISCRGAGNRLREVRICFTKDGDLRSCGPNEEQRRLCSAAKMYVPPVRSSKLYPETPEERERARITPTPRPRVIPGVGRR